MERIAAYEHELLDYAMSRLACIPGVGIGLIQARPAGWLRRIRA